MKLIKIFEIKGHNRIEDVVINVDQIITIKRTEDTTKSDIERQHTTSDIVLTNGDTIRVSAQKATLTQLEDAIVSDQKITYF